jgi:hypothetical protein
VFGSVPVDEVNGANPSETPFADSLRDADPRLRGGYLIDKYYRASFYARAPDQYGFYGANDMYRPQYEALYSSLPATDRRSRAMNRSHGRIGRRMKATGLWCWCASVRRIQLANRCMIARNWRSLD